MIRRFLDYVEIKTKITSTFAFMMAMAWLFYVGQSIRWLPTIVFFGSMFLFDLATTAINNYIDSKTTNKELQFNKKTAKGIILTLMAVSTGLGIYLVYLTDIIVFFVGGLCFLCGVFYTYGPVPISRQPLGEIISGIFYGLFIPFLVLYMNMPQGTYLALGLSMETIFIQLEILPLISIILLAVAPFCTTANIMLANNICDIEKDILVKRYTLPYYLGEKALYLFSALYYMPYAATILMVVLKILSPICLISLLNIFWVKRNIRVFLKNQIKDSTFVVSINNYMIIMGTNTLLIFISGMI